MLRRLQVAAFSLAALAGGTSIAGELASPVKVTADGQPIDVARSGHAAPWVGDFDGDGKHDLLVGEFFDGRCRVFLNRGTHQDPVFKDHLWFEAGGASGRVPSG